MIEQFGNGLLLGIIISVASVALSLLYGVTRIVNFAHGEIIALGAIVTLFFSSPIDSRVLFLDRFSNRIFAKNIFSKKTIVLSKNRKTAIDSEDARM